MPNFVALSCEITSDGRLVLIHTSAARSLYLDNETITSTYALDFLYSLRSLQKQVKNPVFVWYASTLDVEHILKDLAPRAKDIAFPSEEVMRCRKGLREYAAQLRREIKEREGKDCKQLQHVLKITREELRELEAVRYGAYILRVRQEKSLSISRVNERGKAIPGVCIYDVNSFFRRSLTSVSMDYFKQAPEALNRAEVPALPMWNSDETRRMLRENYMRHAQAEVETIKALAMRAACYYEAIGIKLKRWYGASAAASLLLARWKAREQFKRITETNAPRNLYEALERAQYGGRIETLKLGTVEGVYALDTNSAYAYATSLLAIATKGWRYTRQFNPYELYALWRVQWDLPESAYFGVLPFRGTHAQISYRRKGAGWYFSPEVRELARCYPGSFKVKEGYVLPYSRVHFGVEVEKLYKYRRDLKRAGDPGEEIINLTLQSIWGKFAQVVGQPVYNCKAWAGWLQSFVRAQMHAAAFPAGRDCIFFYQDCVHSRVPLQVPVSDAFGEWKQEYYEKVLYLQSGVYEPYGEGARVRKRGLSYIDFNAAVESLNGGWSVEAKREYYVGWRLAQSGIQARAELKQQRFNSIECCMEELEKYPGRYLERVEESLSFNPTQAQHREFETRRIDWRHESLDSSIIKYDAGRESAARLETESARRTHMMLDVVQARRY